MQKIFLALPRGKASKSTRTPPQADRTQTRGAHREKKIRASQPPRDASQAQRCARTMRKRSHTGPHAAHDAQTGVVA